MALKPRALKERALISKQHKDEVKSKLQSVKTTFFNELTDKTNVFKNMNRPELFLAYLFFDLNIPVQQVAVDMGFTPEVLRRRKSDIIKKILQ